jgi:hypothetical protein
MIHKTLNKLRHRIKRVTHHISPRGRQHRNILRSVAEKTGLVYFGSVDQHNDDHVIVRGITASASHQDDHVSVGSINGYDVQLVDRSDSVESHAGRLSSLHYIVLEIQLRARRDLPHILIIPKGQKIPHFEGAFTSPHIQPILLSAAEGYSQEFISRYGIQTLPTYFEEAKSFLDVSITRTLAAHFWPLAIEFHEGALYVYTDDHRVTTHLMENMIQNGLWLAGQIDAK